MKRYKDMADVIEVVASQYIGTLTQIPVRDQIPVICATVDILATEAGLSVAEYFGTLADFMDFMAKIGREFEK